MATGTLLLNASYEPMRILSLKRAINLVLQDKAEVVEESDEAVRSQRISIPVPLVIRLKSYVKVPFRALLPLTRKNLIARDLGKCAYCHKSAQHQKATIDHVFPRSRGGQHVWENVVLACSRCNQLKRDKTLDELGWKLEFVPRPPKNLIWFAVNVDIHPAWSSYLQVA